MNDAFRQKTLLLSRFSSKINPQILRNVHICPTLVVPFLFAMENGSFRALLFFDIVVVLAISSQVVRNSPSRLCSIPLFCSGSDRHGVFVFSFESCPRPLIRVHLTRVAALLALLHRVRDSLCKYVRPTGSHGPCKITDEPNVTALKCRGVHGVFEATECPLLRLKQLIVHHRFLERAQPVVFLRAHALLPRPLGAHEWQ